MKMSLKPGYISRMKCSSPRALKMSQEAPIRKCLKLKKKKEKKNSFVYKITQIWGNVVVMCAQRTPRDATVALSGL